MNLANERKAMFARGLLSATEAAAKVGVAITTIYRWMDDGKIQGEVVNEWRRYVVIDSLVEHLGPTMAAECGLVPRERS